MRGLGALAFLPFVVMLSFSTRPSAGAKDVDLHEECAEWAERGDCKERPSFMIKECAASCRDKPGIRKFDVRTVSDDEPSFFDLEAKNAKGKLMSFSRFEGYITIVVNIARECGHTESYYQALEHLQSIYPYALEIVVFPFNHPGVQQDPDDCPDIRSSELKEGRKIHVMEVVHVNGPNTHPVYRYFKNKFDTSDLEDKFAHYFLINPDGDKIELHYGANYLSMKQYIKNHLKVDLGDRNDRHRGSEL